MCYHVTQVMQQGSGVCYDSQVMQLFSGVFCHTGNAAVQWCVFLCITGNTAVQWCVLSHRYYSSAVVCVIMYHR